MYTEWNADDSKTKWRMREREKKTITKEKENEENDRKKEENCQNMTTTNRSQATIRHSFPTSSSRERERERRRFEFSHLPTGICPSSLRQMIVGVGVPSTWQANWTSSPVNDVWSIGSWVNSGLGREKGRGKNMGRGRGRIGLEGGQKHIVTIMEKSFYSPKFDNIDIEIGPLAKTPFHRKVLYQRKIHSSKLC